MVLVFPRSLLFAVVLFRFRAGRHLPLKRCGTDARDWSACGSFVRASPRTRAQPGCTLVEPKQKTGPKKGRSATIANRGLGGSICGCRTPRGLRGSRGNKKNKQKKTLTLPVYKQYDKIDKTYTQHHLCAFF